MANSHAPREWINSFRHELLAGLQSQEFTEPVEFFTLSESPRVVAIVVGLDSATPEAVIRNLDSAIAADEDATLESVALDIAVSDIAEPGPQGIPLDASALEVLKQRWPAITFIGDVAMYQTI